MESLLSIRGLSVSFAGSFGAPDVRVLRDVSFDVPKGSVTAIVGESGCGKSLTARSVLKLMPPAARIEDGSRILFQGRDVLSFDDRELRSYRGKSCSMVFQDALAALDPTMRIGDQIAEKILVHGGSSRAEARDQAVRMLDLVGIPDAAVRARQYPHEFSGGMRQRAMIALALTLEPELVIADEPTTALDVTVQADIIDVFKRMREQTGMTVILITHDLGIVANFAERIVVMYAGRVVETGSSADIFYAPAHPYTEALLAAVPRVDVTHNELTPIEGMPPDTADDQVGCPFAPRCPHACERCAERVPELEVVGDGHRARCWRTSERRAVTDSAGFADGTGPGSRKEAL